MLQKSHCMCGFLFSAALHSSFISSLSVSQRQNNRIVAIYSGSLSITCIYQCHQINVPHLSHGYTRDDTMSHLGSPKLFRGGLHKLSTELKWSNPASQRRPVSRIIWRCVTTFCGVTFVGEFCVQTRWSLSNLSQSGGYECLKQSKYHNTLVVFFNHTAGIVTGVFAKSSIWSRRCCQRSQSLGMKNRYVILTE